MNNLENSEILSKEMVIAVDLIIERCPQVVFGGSIALNAIGLLNRTIHDIDLFFNENQSHNFTGFLSLPSDKIQSETITMTNGKTVQRTGLIINDIKVCAFKVEAEQLQHSLFKFSGREIKIQNVNYAIQAKLAYSQRTDKHIKDLIGIDNILKQLFPNI